MDKDRLYWQCRRGMLELDVWLQGFITRGYDALNESEQAAFITLLDYPDPVLLDTLMGHMVPVDPVIAHVVQQIRRATHP